MFELSSSVPANAPSLSLALRRAGTGIALLGAVALWPWALPALVTHDGFIFRGSDACAPESYRDPVTGQSRPAPSARIAIRDVCTPPAPGGRP